MAITMLPRHASLSLISLFCALLCILLFGLNYIIIKAGVAHIPPLFLSAMRLALFGCVMVWFVPMPKNSWGKLLALSLTQFTLNYGLCAIALKNTDAGIASILTQMEVPFAFILGIIFLREKLVWQQVAGCVLALLGTVLIVNFRLENSQLMGMAMILFAAFIYAVSCFQTKSLTEVSASTMTVWCALLAAPQLLLFSIFHEKISYDVIQSSFPYMIYIVLASTSTGISFVLWARLIKTYSVSQIMPFALLIPVVGVVGGIIFFDETLTLKIIIGGIIITFGVALVLFKDILFQRRKEINVANEGDVALEAE